MAKKANRNKPQRLNQRLYGKSLRKVAPLKSHSEWQPAGDRPDPIALLQAQDEGRIESLLPIRYGRMLASPFAFLRGSAAVMASDLAGTPASGIRVFLCGDAHLSNFGVFATPERRLVFDLNDFDEAFPGPWEWDLKRLAASAVVAGRQNGFKDKQNRKLARVVVQAYKKFMDRFANMSIMDVWYYHVEAEETLKLIERYSAESGKKTRKMLAKARTKTQARTLAKLTQEEYGRRQFVNEPPLLVRLDDFMTEEQKAMMTEETINQAWSDYLSSLPEDRRLLLSRYRLADGALRVGGVGSVGTHCTILLLEGGAKQDAIILQQKEAGPSVLEDYLPGHDFGSAAKRVVIGQRTMQASSDIFLGYHRSSYSDREFYWRQLKDMKGSVDVSTLDVSGLGSYLAACSICLARAHARTGEPAQIAGYIGSGDQFEKAIAKFAIAYADQTEEDYQLLVAAVEAERIEARTGI